MGAGKIATYSYGTRKAIIGRQYSTSRDILNITTRDAAQAAQVDRWLPYSYLWFLHCRSFAPTAIFLSFHPQNVLLSWSYKTAVQKHTVKYSKSFSKRIFNSNITLICPFIKINRLLFCISIPVTFFKCVILQSVTICYLPGIPAWQFVGNISLIKNDFFLISRGVIFSGLKYKKYIFI